MIRVRVEVGKNIKKCCVDKDLDTDVGADIALDYQHKIVQEYVRPQLQKTRVDKIIKILSTH